MKIASLIVLATVTFGAVNHGWAQTSSPDILSVVVGEDATKAVSSLKTSNPALKEFRITNPDFGMLGGQPFDFVFKLLDATPTNWGPRETIQVGVGGVGTTQYVTHLGRELNYKDGDAERPAVKQIVAALTEKYGKAATAHSDSGGISTMYVYDLNKKLLRENLAGPCLPDHWANFINQFNGSCGLSVVWFVEPALDNPGLVRQMRVFIKDDQLFFKSLKERKAAVAQEQGQQTQSAVGRKPPRL